MKALGKLILIYLILMLLIVAFPNLGDLFESFIDWILGFSAWAKLLIIALIIYIFIND